ncbi:hypothetical protein V8G54_019714 [Vigna mungo]|uniref:Uncharacterized protein n=1 Tax=Vigna mungo TaxID=3915 RepID=A0AAQ3NE02_VIGMU
MCFEEALHSSILVAFISWKWEWMIVLDPSSDQAPPHSHYLHCALPKPTWSTESRHPSNHGRSHLPSHNHDPESPEESGASATSGTSSPPHKQFHLTPHPTVHHLPVSNTRLHHFAPSQSPRAPKSRTASGSSLLNKHK